MHVRMKKVIKKHDFSSKNFKMHNFHYFDFLYECLNNFLHCSISTGQNRSYNFNLELGKKIPWEWEPFCKIVKIIFFSCTSNLSQSSLAANLVYFIASHCWLAYSWMINMTIYNAAADLSKTASICYDRAIFLGDTVVRNKQLLQRILQWE
jgi:hypothetical protein